MSLTIQKAIMQSQAGNQPLDCLTWEEVERLINELDKPDLEGVEDDRAH